MTERSSFRGIAVVYLILALGAMATSWPPEIPTLTAISMAPFAVGMVYIDRWVHWVTPRLQWSYGSVIAMAAMILSPHGQAAFVGAVLGIFGALTDQELKKPEIWRIAVNAAQLALAGLATGFVIDSLRPTANGPSVGLLAAVLAAIPVTTAVSGVLVTVAIRYRYGTWVRSSVVTASLLLGWRKVPPTIATAAIAATVAVIGPAWILFALVQIGALGAIPIVRSRLEARRRDIMQAVTSALNARGVVGSAHDRLEETALTLGHRLGLTADQIEQLRYVSLLYSMTDQFATSLPRSFEDQLRGLRDNAFSSALLLGLPLNDVADSRVVRIADAAAQYEALVNPVEGEDPLSPNEAAAELLRSGTSPNLIAALLAEKPLSDSYLRAWDIDPGSPWQRPMRWLNEHAS